MPVRRSGWLAKAVAASQRSGGCCFGRSRRAPVRSSSPVQAAIINLLADLRDAFGLAYLFISHDLAVVAQLASRIAVMYRGSICELGSARDVLCSPRHPYTQALLAAVPQFRANGFPAAA